MSRSGSDVVIIAGGGLAGSLAALALARLRPEAPILLIEQGTSFGGNHIWSFFDDDVAAEDRWLIEPIVAARWDAYDVRFPRRVRTLSNGYNSARSALLDVCVRQTLRPDQYRLGASIEALSPCGAVLTGGERLQARAVIDARGPTDFGSLQLGWQRFLGREYCLQRPHGLIRPTVMDAEVDQEDGYRFVYCLPFDEDRLLIEDTYYVLGAGPDEASMAERITAYAAARGWTLGELEAEEHGALPVVTGGDFDLFWPRQDPVARLGLRGGFFHPTTGYSLPDAVRTALLVGRQRELDGEALGRALRREAKRLWRARRFYRLLNRMLFHASPAKHRYKILEHFYRLDPGLVARFYAGKSRLADKVRILSGRPPVPIGRAIAALWK
jgi:lycopene beta-cyclase